MKSRYLQTAFGLLLSLTHLSAVAAIATGTGFFVTNTGYIVTNQHVVGDESTVKFLNSEGKVFRARVVARDPANDLALLKGETSKSSGIPMKSTLDVEKGDTVFTLGFPNPSLQGFESKYTSGEISSFSGLGDATNVLQITTPLQPGNSGGPLIDSTGNVVGVVVARINALAVLREEKYLPENVNFAVKSDHVFALLKKIPKSERLALGSGVKRPVSAYEKSVVLIVANVPESEDKAKQGTAKNSTSPPPPPPSAQPAAPPAANSLNLPPLAAGTRQVSVNLPALSENGCVVPVQIKIPATLRVGDELRVLVNGELAHRVRVEEGTLAGIGLRLRAERSSNLLVQCSMCESKAVRMEVKLGCTLSSGTAAPGQTRVAHKPGNLRSLLAGNLGEGTSVVASTARTKFSSQLTKFSSLNPYLSFESSDMSATGCIFVKNGFGESKECARY